VLLGILIGLSAPARAQDVDAPQVTHPASGTGEAAREGLFLPSTLAANVGVVPAFVSAYSGYDGARRALVASATAEIRLWGPVALRGGSEYSANGNRPRPTVGLRGQLLHQQIHGIDGTASVFYRAEGFTEPEGEIETVLSFGRRFDRTALFGNLVYGQDPEGNERDGEIRLALLRSYSRWTIGIDSRLRIAIGPQHTRQTVAEPSFDMLAGPVATVALGPMAVFAEAGPSLIKVANQISVGVAGVGGVGTSF
jgi:hypothetical protein